MQLRTMLANDETMLDGAYREAPDPDSSDVCESVRLLHVAVAQIDLTMHEGDASAAVLSGAVSSIATGLKSIGKCAQESSSAGEPAQKRFTMESERRVFDALIRGMPMDESVCAAKPEGAEPLPAGAIHLF